MKRKPALPYANRLVWGLFILASLGLCFLGLADFVSSELTPSIDTKIILMLRNSNDLTDPIGPIWFEEMMRDITGLGGVGMLTLVTLVVIGYLYIQHHKAAALLILIGIASGMLVSFALKYGFSRPRPDLVPHGSYVYTSSFPSGHAMMSSLVYLTLSGLLAQLEFRKRIKAYFYFIAVLLTVSIGISRVYLGVHWPSDVLAGWIVGSGWAMLIYIIHRHVLLKSKFEQKKPELSN